MNHHKLFIGPTVVVENPSKTAIRSVKALAAAKKESANTHANKIFQENIAFIRLSAWVLFKYRLIMSDYRDIVKAGAISRDCHSSFHRFDTHLKKMISASSHAVFKIFLASIL